MKIFFKIVLKYESFSKEENNRFQLFKKKKIALNYKIKQANLRNFKI